MECGTNATSAALVSLILTEGSDGVYGVGLDANQQGTFSEDQPRNIGAPGDQVSLTLECMTGPLSSPTILAADGTHSFGIPSVASAGDAAGEAFAQVICGVGPAPTLPLDSFPELTLSIRSASFQMLPTSLPATGSELQSAPLALGLLAITVGAAFAARGLRRPTA